MGNPLADPAHQLAVLQPKTGQRTFENALSESGLHPLRAVGIETLQVNVGKLCNMTCEHCHVDAGPDRREQMTRETAEACIDVLAQTDIPTLDLTGGVPEMNPHFRWLVQAACGLGRHVIDRCNLTILRWPGFSELPEFMAQHQVEIVASLPCYLAENVDAQRGDHAFERSIAVLQQLNALGYGQSDSGLQLTLVYNPVGPSLPPPQQTLEEAYRRELAARYGVQFTAPDRDHEHADQSISKSTIAAGQIRTVHGAIDFGLQPGRGGGCDVPQHTVGRLEWPAVRLRFQSDAGSDAAE